MAKRGANKGGGIQQRMAPKGGIKKQAPKQRVNIKGAGRPQPANNNRGPKVKTKGMTLATIMPKAAPPPKPSGRHSLLLMQTTAAKASRTWSDYQTTPALLEGVVAIFEQALKKLNPGAVKLTYTVADLQTYVDSLYDCSVLLADAKTKQYEPKGKDFLKQQLMQKFRSAAS